MRNFKINARNKLTTKCLLPLYGLILNMAVKYM